MIGGILASMGVGWWLPLGLFPVFGFGLALLYRNRSKGVRRVVPTFFLLREFVTEAKSPSAIRLPWRFFLELLILLVLCCAAAGIAFDTKGKSVAIVLDTSLSMNARKSVTQAGFVFDEAKKRALEHIGELDVLSQVTVFSSAPVLKQRSAEGGTPSEAKAALARIEATVLGDSLSLAIGEIAQRGLYDRILVFTDRQPELTSAQVSLSPKGAIRPEVMTVRAPQGASRSNVALGGVSSSSGGEAKGLTAKLISYSDSNSNGTVSVQTLSKSRVWNTTPMFSERVKVEAGQQVDIKLSFAMDPGQPYRIVWDSDTSNPSAQDMLSQDDEAFFVFTSGDHDWKVVSAFSDKQLNLTKPFEGRVRFFTPDEFDALAPSAKVDSKIVFHGLAPKELPKTPYVIVNPPLGSAVVASAASSQIPVTWDSAHPLLSYVDIGALKFPDARVLTTHPGMEEIIGLPEGALMVASDAQMGRGIVVGFELFPFEGATAVTKSTLLLNMLKWVNASAVPGSLGGNNLLVGQRIDGSSSNDAFRYLGFDDGKPLATLTRGGLLTRGDEFKAVSLINSVESNLMAQPALPRAYPTGQKRKTDDNRSLSWLFAFFAIGLLIFDALMQLRSSLRRTAA
jgi:hypothetical protein